MVKTSVPGSNGLITGLLILGITLSGLIFSAVRLRQIAQCNQVEKEYSVFVKNQLKSNEMAIQGITNGQ
ncbi:MAG: hypothetical protein MJ162_00015 [Treponema sp.]|nr:hypothetical protein [Treponema sp.]